MRTKTHWKECENLMSYFTATHIALQIMENAKQRGYNPRGVKVLNKQQTMGTTGTHADSSIVWEEGPIGWALTLEILPVWGVCIEPRNDHILTFYDI